MVYLIEAYGNHSNRILQQMHLEAFCKSSGVDFINPTIGDMLYPYKMSKNYNFFSSYLINFFLKINKIIYKLTRRYFFLKVIDLETGEGRDKFIELIKLKKNIFIKGWAFRDFDNVGKYKDYFKERFSLLEPIKKETLNRFENDKVKLGVHIRRGDYIEFQDGKFYFSDEEYIKLIKKAISVIGSSVAVYIFSNERLDEEKFIKELGNDLFFSKNPYYVDQYLMSLCDYLIGPPSTFTIVASFMGK
nr:alpha-1,2-fucosyltransferase [Spirochaetota bacterium]